MDKVVTWKELKNACKKNNVPDNATISYNAEYIDGNYDVLVVYYNREVNEIQLEAYGDNDYYDGDCWIELINNDEDAKQKRENIKIGKEFGKGLEWF